MSDPCVAEVQDQEWLSKADWLAWHNHLILRKSRVRDTRLVFLGDSITAGWLTEGRAAWKEYFAAYKPLNLGVGGDGTSQVLWRIENGELDGIRPRVVVVLIGTNNIGNSGQTGPEAARGVRCVVEAVRAKLPESKILLLAVFPRDERPGTDFRREIDGLNAAVRGLHDGQRVHYLDLAGAFLREDGSLPVEWFPDTLHLSAQAYEVWAGAMMPVLRTLLME